LPNRPLLSNSSLPVTIPNLPAFEQSAYNGRPRKIVPEPGSAVAVGGSSTVVKNALESGKDFLPLNGVNPSSTPPSASVAAPVQVDRGVLPSQQPLPPAQQDPTEDGQQIQLFPPPQLGDSKHSQQFESEQVQSSDTESSQLTAIFRPDEAGEWRERLNTMRQASSHSAHVKGTSDTGLSDERHPLGSGAASWDGQLREEEDDDDGKEEEEDGEVDEVNVTGEGEGGKVWRARKTLRK
jgi:striatin 1/3/4